MYENIEQYTEREEAFEVNDLYTRLKYDLRTKDIKYLRTDLKELPETMKALGGKVPIIKKNGIIEVDIQTL